MILCPLSSSVSHVIKMVLLFLYKYNGGQVQNIIILILLVDRMFGRNPGANLPMFLEILFKNIKHGTHMKLEEINKVFESPRVDLN